jgi:hypothetical protein
MGLGRFGRLGSQAGFRRNSGAINGQLTAFLRLVSKWQKAIFGAAQENGVS